MNKHTLLFFLVSLPILTFSQIKVLKEAPFEIGEKESYHAIYKWGLIEIKAGLVEFSTEQTFHKNDSCFHFKSIGNSVPKYDWIFKVRDTFQSVVRISDFQPLFYERNTSEGGYHVLNRSYFMEDTQQIKLELFNSEKGSSEKQIPFERNLFDLQTAVYYARMLDFSEAFMGEEYLFKVLIDGVYYKIPIRYEGLEIIELGEYSYPCFRISTKVIEGTIFKSNQTIKIWVASDGSQVPVKVEAPIIVGKVKAELVN